MNLHISFNFALSNILFALVSWDSCLDLMQKNVCCNLHGQKLQACDLPVTSWQVELYVKVPTLGLGRWHRASRCQPSVRQDSHPEFYQVATRKDQGQAPAAENGLSKDLTKTDLENNRTENKTLLSKMLGFTKNSIVAAQGGAEIAQIENLQELHVRSWVVQRLDKNG